MRRSSLEKTDPQSPDADESRPKSMFARSVLNAAARGSKNSKDLVPQQDTEDDRSESSVSSEETPSSPELPTPDLTEDHKVERDFARSIPTPPLPGQGKSQIPSSENPHGFDDNEDSYKSQEKKQSSMQYDRIAAPVTRISSPEKFSRELHRSLSEGAWKEMYELLMELQDQPSFIGPALMLPGADQATVLHIAAWKAPPALTRFIVESVAGRNASSICMARDADGNTPLHLYAANLDEVTPGKLDINVLKCLVQNAPRSLQIQNSQGDTPLHLLVSSPAFCQKTDDFALEAAAEAAVSIMLDTSMDAAVAQDSTGATPLHVAIAHRAHERVLMRLMETCPVSAKVEDNQGMLPLHYLAAFGCISYSAMTLLVKSYPEAISHASLHGDTPLHTLTTNAASLLSGDVLSERNLSRLVELLMGMDTYMEEGDTPKSPLLIENADQLNPLHCCALFATSPKIVSLLMTSPYAAKAASLPNSFGATPLHMMCASPNVSNLMDTVISLATPEAANALDRLKRTPLHVASQNSHSPSELIKILLRLCPEAAEMRTQRGHLALHLAAQSQVRDSVVKALLRAYPEAAEERNKSDNTPLHDAAKYQASVGVVKMLLDAFPDAVFIQNQYGNLPLHCATAYKADSEVIELLLRTWPDGASMQNRTQDAPLHYAAANSKSVSVVRALIDAAPAAVLLTNSSGQTPIDGAKEAKAPGEIVDLLEESAYEFTKKASADGGWGSFAGR